MRFAGSAAEVVLHGANFDEAKAHALELAASLGMTFIPPFDHPSVIAGQATIALELLQQNAGSTESLYRSAVADWPPGVAVFIKHLMPDIKSDWCRGRKGGLSESRTGYRTSGQRLPKVGLFCRRCRQSNGLVMRPSVYVSSIWMM